MTDAQLVLFVVDAQNGLTSADEDIASLLRRKGIKTVLIANKADGPKADVILGDFARLGLGTPVGVSAMNDRNLDQVYAAISRNLDLSDAPAEIPEPQMMVAIVGKRNAGKSTLVNAFAEIYEGHGDRVIVSEVPGTTRDSIDVRFEKEGKTLVVIDTAGVRKKRHMVTNDVEFYSFHRAERSIRRADVVLMLIDATEPVSEPDKKLAAYIASSSSPVILVVNKWDLAKEQARELRKEKGRAQGDRGRRPGADGEVPRVPRRGAQAPRLRADRVHHGQGQAQRADGAGPVAAPVQAGDRARPARRLNDGDPHDDGAARPQHAQRAGGRGCTTRRRPTSRRRRSCCSSTTPTYFNETYQRYMINRFRELLPSRRCRSA
jgi:small GTP-binding protein